MTELLPFWRENGSFQTNFSFKRSLSEHLYKKWPTNLSSFLLMNWNPPQVQQKIYNTPRKWMTLVYTHPKSAGKGVSSPPQIICFAYPHLRMFYAAYLSKYMTWSLFVCYSLYNKQNNAKKYNAMQSNTMQWNEMQCNASLVITKFRTKIQLYFIHGICRCLEELKIKKTKALLWL